MWPRTDDELRAQSPHVFWHLRQVVRLAAHLEHCRRNGRSVMFDALDAAALEAFAVSARALIEFFWGERKLRRDGTPVYPDDARSIDWFRPDAEAWAPGPKPEALQRLTDRVGWGIAHVSYRRIDPSEEWGWRHLDVSHHLASRFYDFASAAPIQRVTPDFEQEVYEEIIDYRKQTDDPLPFPWLADPVGPVGTPGHAITIANLRSSPSSDSQPPRAGLVVRPVPPVRSPSRGR